MKTRDVFLMGFKKSWQCSILNIVIGFLRVDEKPHALPIDHSHNMRSTLKKKNEKIGSIPCSGK